MTEERYSTYETKARLSEILRKVRRGREVIISSRGVPVARIIPYEKEREDHEERLDRLAASGVLGPARGRLEAVPPLGERTGALERFLDDRD